jgi:thymidylate kinase
MDQKIIILEGCDGTGKTEIGKELSRILNIPYFKNNKEHIHFFDENITKYRFLDQLYIYEFLKQTKYSVIIDRAFPSDIVYTNVFRPNKELINTLYDIDEKFSNLNTIIIYCYKQNHFIDDEIIDSSKYLSITNEYEKYLLYTKCRVINLNTTDENLNREINEILEKW